MSATSPPKAVPSVDELAAELPLLSQTPESWARLAADNLPIFLADHAICEQHLSILTLLAVVLNLFQGLVTQNQSLGDLDVWNCNLISSFSSFVLGE